ncbi:MAG: hypothetical protein JWQ38_2878 [Flavipsychrobacter sp.]|nr:hypothetical protein [Flavipsychrobacter sp.]
MNYLFSLLSFVMLLTCATNTVAQKQGKKRIDSLESVLTMAKDDTNKIKILNSLSFICQNTDPDKGVKYGEQGLALSGELEWDKMNGKLNASIAADYLVRSDFSKALSYYFKALKINEEKNNKTDIASNTVNIGSVYNLARNYSKATEYYSKAIRLFEDVHDKSGIAVCVSNIGSICYVQHDLACATEKYIEAIRIHEEIDNKEGVSENLGNLGTIYNELGKYADALSAHMRALNIDKELGNKNGIARNTGCIGQVYLGIVKDTSWVAVKGDHVPASKKECLEKAIEYLREGIALSKEIDCLETIIEFNKNLSDAYMLAGNVKGAFDAYKEYISTKDSVFSIDNNVKIANLETERAIALKNKQIEIDKLAVAKKRNERTFFIAGIVLMMIIILIILRNFRKQKTTNRLLSVEKKKSEDLLLNILPAEVADELKETGIAEARLFDNTTVLFTDFIDFTMAGERMTPKELVSELHECFKAFDGILSAYKIEKIKTVGDAYIAVSGLPVANPKHAEEIVAAAIAINEFMLKRYEQMGNATFRMRLGVHTGSVVAGIVGVKKFGYDIWGDTVNTAARMEQNSEPGKINISNTTYELVKDKFTCTYRGEIQAKNKGEMRMYFVE